MDHWQEWCSCPWMVWIEAMFLLLRAVGKCWSEMNEIIYQNWQKLKKKLNSFGMINSRRSTNHFVRLSCVELHLAKACCRCPFLASAQFCCHLCPIQTKTNFLRANFLCYLLTRVEYWYWKAREWRHCSRTNRDVDGIEDIPEKE